METVFDHPMTADHRSQGVGDEGERGDVEAGLGFEFAIGFPFALDHDDRLQARPLVVVWNFELGAIPVLLKQGWKRDSLKPGDQVTVEGYLAKDGSKSMANARKVTLPDGRRVFGGSSVDNPAQ